MEVMDVISFIKEDTNVKNISFSKLQVAWQKIKLTDWKSEEGIVSLL